MLEPHRLHLVQDFTTTKSKKREVEAMIIVRAMALVVVAALDRVIFGKIITWRSDLKSFMVTVSIRSAMSNPSSRFSCLYVQQFHFKYTSFHFGNVCGCVSVFLRFSATQVFFLVNSFMKVLRGSHGTTDDECRSREARRKWHSVTSIMVDIRLVWSLLLRPNLYQSRHHEGEASYVE